MKTITSINPSNYKEIGSIKVSTDSEIKNTVVLARKSFITWGSRSIEDRVKMVRSIVKIFRDNKVKLAYTQSEEMGMPLNDAIEDVNINCEYIEWYLDNAKKYLSEEITYKDKKAINKVVREPIGVVAVIIPWNFPFANVVWGAFQSMIAGNTIVLKHSEECPLSSKLIDGLINDGESKLPRRVFNTVYGDGDVGYKLASSNIDMIAFTGSTKTGKILYKLAGEKFIKANMELGGSAPGIVFKDADLDFTCNTVCFQRLFNQGQICDGLKRLIVHESILNQMVKCLSDKFRTIKLGNPLKSTANDPFMGPLVSKKQLNTLIGQVDDAVKKGAKIVVGGHSLEKKMNGAYFEPTILTNVKANMRVMIEEVFGPVLPIITFKTSREAIELANETIYGLGAYVFTKDLKLASKVASELESGMVSINGENYLRPSNPFGGHKNSGFGREHGKYGFEDVTKVKVVAVPR